jgi:hypothetical protein
LITAYIADLTRTRRGAMAKQVPAGALDEEVTLAAHTAPVAHPSHAAEGGNVVNPGVHHVLAQ